MTTNAKIIALPAAALVVALLIAAAYSGWMRYGTDLLLTYAERGLSLCL